jgi:heat shock protein HspQ
MRQLLQGLQQRIGPEHEDLVGDEVAGRLVGLVGVVAHDAVMGLHDAIATGLVGVDLGGDHRDRGVARHVLLDQRAVVLDVDRIGAENNQGLGRELADERRVAPQGIRGAGLEAAAVARAQPRLQEQQAADRPVQVPRPAVGQVVAERDRVELLHDPHVRQPGVAAVAQREVDQPMGSGERHCGLGALLGEELEAPTGAAREDDHEGPGARHGPGRSHDLW